MVVPLGKCVARPDVGGTRYPLVDHLLRVASACGSPGGDPIEQLAFLKGLLHDVGKATSRWQDRIRNRPDDLPPHSWVGAYLYAAIVYETAALDPAKNPDLLPHVIGSVLDIAHHHTALGDPDRIQTPWRQGDSTLLTQLDLDGVNELIRAHLPFVLPLPGGDVLASARYRQKVAHAWAKWVVRLPRAIDALSEEERIARAVRTGTAKLIRADRYDVAGLSEHVLTRDKAEAALGRLVECVRQLNASAASKSEGERRMAQLRKTATSKAVDSFLVAAGRERFYSLELPTGMGKTLTGLRLALESAAAGRVRRIVYVTPYLSILSQAADDIREKTGLDVLEHHHLAALTQEAYTTTDSLDLLMESWQAPVVVTTFNQFVRGLFPQRAQQAMRLEALKNAFLIIDEPQIMEPEIWNLVLRFLDVAVRRWDGYVLIMSATMPPLHGLHSVVRIEPTEKPEGRFQIDATERTLDADALADRVAGAARQDRSVAVILNTIRDAVQVYKAVQSRTGSDVVVVHGLMTPLHKAAQIERVKKLLDARSPAISVSTQTLEAGVDVSFRRLFRAYPVLPSVIQAAGRVNRHSEEQLGTVELFTIERCEKDTRRYVYRNNVAREISDALMPPGASFLEHEAYDVLRRYFVKLFQRYPATGYIERLERAAAGEWDRLASVEVFGDKPEGSVPVFIPWMPDALPQNTESAITSIFSSFGLDAADPDQLYERYEERGWLARLSVVERKRFMALLQQFTVPIKFEIAKLIAVGSEDRAIWRLADLEESYDSESGLGPAIDSETEPSTW